jgi:hypothetical protein
MARSYTEMKVTVHAEGAREKTDVAWIAARQGRTR